MAGPLAAVDIVFRVLQVLVVANIIISWVPSLRYHPLSQWVLRLTDPMLRPFRAIVPVGAGGLDFSPVILLMVLWLAQWATVRLLASL